MSELLAGEFAPDFTLPTVRGDTVSLTDFRDVKNVVLVFNRGLM